MRILGLFDKYFLLLMIFQGIITIVIDSNDFKKTNMTKVSEKARKFGYITIGLSIILFTISTITK